MKTGNVTGNVYKRSVHRKIGTNGIGVKGAEYGEGCAFLTSENVDKAPEKAKQLWITAQSLSVWSGAEGAKLCVYEAVNRAAAAAVGRGEAKVRMVSMQLMLPADCQEQELQKMTVAAQEAAQKLREKQGERDYVLTQLAFSRATSRLRVKHHKKGTALDIFE
mgnify:CR=1 FL=1